MALRDIVGGIGTDAGSDGSAATVDWRARTQDLLFEGETVEEAVDVGETGHVVVTSHRVLTFTPTLEGPNFQQVDRPNVDGVSTGTRSNGDHFLHAVEYGLVGALLIGVGMMVDFGSMIGDVSVDGSAASRIGVGNVIGMLQGLLDLLEMLDQILLLVGLALVLVGLVFGWLFVRSRDYAIVLEIAGEDDLYLPRPPVDAGPDVERLERALGFTVDHSDVE